MASPVIPGASGSVYTPARIGVLPSIEMVVWVAAGGRGTLVGAVLGAIGVNWLQSWLTTSYPDLWLIVLGGLFMGVVLFFPDGAVGGLRRLGGLLRRSRPGARAMTAPLGQASLGPSRAGGSDTTA